MALALVAVAWGAFAFGAVYDWAYVPLSWGCAVIGLLGLVAGRVSLRRLLPLSMALLLIGCVGLIQLIPLRPDLLASVSPGTDRYLRAYDLGYSLSAAGSPPGDAAVDARRFPISIAPEETARALALFAGLSLFLLGLLRTMSGSAALRAARGVVAIGTVLAFIGIVQKALVGDDVFLGMRIYGFWKPENLVTTPFGPFVNKNHFAGWMIMATPLAFGLAMRALETHTDERGDLRQRLLWLADAEGAGTVVVIFAAFLMITSLLLTRSRSGLACLLLTAMSAAWMVVRRGESTRRSLGLIGGVGLLLGLSLLWAGSDTAIGRLATNSSSLTLRLGIWRDAVAIVRDFPVLGAGLNTFGTANIEYQQSGDLHYQEAHNDYLQILAEGGLALGAIVLATIVAIVSTSVQRFRRGGDRQDLYWVRVGAVLGLLGIAVQSAVEFSLQMPGNATLFVMVLAIALYSPSTVDPRQALLTVPVQPSATRRRRRSAS